ncbi:MAG: 50S ribosomal protein L25/general stress protein Ctc, partial [Gemmatimonadaceae bacterium]|nr:50S ribosomal protein L25/general stress protein Ctc [Gemmatimonadaceae bacterium]
NRNDTGKGVARKLRSAGRTPAVIYGHGIAPRALSLDTHEFELLLEKVSYRTTVFELAVDGAKSNALIREIQRHPYRKEILHVDFQELIAGEKVTVKVPISYVGSSIGVKEGGIIDQIMHDFTIRVDPMQIPAKIEVDVTSLAIGKSLHVGDVKMPEGVEVLDDADATICTCAAPKEEKAPEATDAAAAAAVAEPEVLSKGKKEEEEGAEAEKKA